MKTINLTTGENVKKMMFPDSQPHIILQNISPGEDVRVVAPIRSALELVQLMMVSNALKTITAPLQQLVIPYLMGARYDRVMNYGDSFDLEMISEIINGFNANEVAIYDVHSTVALDLIKNSHCITNMGLVKKYNKPNGVLIIPDKGAQKKASHFPFWNHKLVDVITCEKTRDKEGKVSLTVNNPEVCQDRNCIIIDDICDGGATFLAIADQIQPKHLTLMVSHGIFSKGTAVLKKKFHDIITTDSFFDWNTNDITLHKLNL